MQEIDFNCIPRCAGPCDNINRETMNVLGNWYFLKPHDGRPIQQLSFQSKNGSRVVLKNFRVCEACFRTFIGKDFHVSDIEKKCKVVSALEQMHDMGYDVQYEAKTAQSWTKTVATSLQTYFKGKKSKQNSGMLPDEIALPTVVASLAIFYVSFVIPILFLGRVFVEDNYEILWQFKIL